MHQTRIDHNVHNQALFRPICYNFCYKCIPFLIFFFKDVTIKQEVAIMISDVEFDESEQERIEVHKLKYLYKL